MEMNKAREQLEKISQECGSDMLKWAYTISALAIASSAADTKIDAAIRSDIVLAALQVMDVAAKRESCKFWLGIIRKMHSENISHPFAAMEELLCDCGRDANDMMRKRVEKLQNICEIAGVSNKASADAAK